MSDSDQEPKPYTPRWISCPIEESLLGEDRKHSRQERKRLSAKDRSKYKKSDQDQREKLRREKEDREGEAPGERGRVLSIQADEVLVAPESGEKLMCTIRGVLKKEKQRLKNLVIVGDFVRFQREGNEGVVIGVEPRKSVLSRAETLSHRKEHLIAANVEQVIITMAIVNPRLRPTLIDRYLIAADKGDMRPLIVINKIDQLQDPNYSEFEREVEKEILEECQRAYAIAKIPLLTVSAATGEGLNALEEAMKAYTSVFSGPSGVGKSSLINAVSGMELKVGEGAGKRRKGLHTTTTAQLLPLKHGGWCVDTPGIKSFGLWELEKEEIAFYFPEMQQYAPECRYPNCTHSHEEQCAVKDAVEKELISPLRYESYLALLAEAEQEHKRR